ncbi:MAG: PHP domain-containing protein, partial [Chloroflexi bacterium]|nr:PHP domain-containing protein [Chloroflexota bacterium]
MQASPRSDFVHLHVHSEFSLLDGMGKIPQLVSAAREQGMRALALTDHGSMYGAMNFYLEARRQGIQPIVGCEVYVAARAMDKKEGRRDQSSTHLTLLAENEVGYRNLIGMVSRAHLEGFYYRPRIDLDLLAAHSDGIVCLSGCPSSEVSRRIRQGNTDSALELAGFYRELFGADRFFVEVMNHGLDFERQLNVGLLEISKRLQAPLVGTQDVHYVGREDRDAHDALLCIGTKSRVADADRLRMEGHYHLAGPEEMAGVLAEFP